MMKTFSFNDFKQLCAQSLVWLKQNKCLYLSSFIQWHAGSIQGSNPVLYVRDLGIKRERDSAHFSVSLKQI